MVETTPERLKLGKIIRDRRMDLRCTQKDLAEAVNLEWYNMISQMELGYVPIPPALWESLAIALGLEVTEFVVLCMSTAEPHVYEALFGKIPQDAVVDVIKSLRAEYGEKK